MLADALNSNRIAYLTSVFFPFFTLTMILRFCGIKRRNNLVPVSEQDGMTKEEELVPARIRALPGKTCIAVTHRSVAVTLADWEISI